MSDILDDIRNASTLDEAVLLTVGAASACWENLEGAGIFESDRAIEVADALIARLS